MALLRKLFARKAMDGLSCISERVYIFNSCLSSEPLDHDDRNDHLISTVIQLKTCHPHDASLMLLNLFAASNGGGGRSSLPADALRQHGVAVVDDYPCHRYSAGQRGCPSLPLATTDAILRSCVAWLVTNGQRNVLLMHCEDSAWPALALAMASLLVYMEEPAPELKTTLATVYGRAPAALLAAGSPLDPQPSHLRYLQYVTKLRESTTMDGMRHKPIILDCLILRAVPDFDGNGGCRAVIRVHGRRKDDHADDDSPKVLFTTPRIKQQFFRQYNQAKSVVIKANIECQVQGDVVVECAHVTENTDDEEPVFRIMFNTCFVQSNMMVLTLDDIDLPWNCTREIFHEDFKIEVFFTEVELDVDSPSTEMLGDSHDGNAEEFYDFDEILIDSGLNSKKHEWHGKEDTNKPSDTTSGSSDEKRSTGSDSEIRVITETDVITESKDSLAETGNVQDGSSSVIQLNLHTNKDPNPAVATELKESTSRRAPEVIIHQVEESSIQEGATSNVRSEVNSNMGGALNPQPKRTTWQDLSKQSAIPIVKKKARKPDIGSDVKKPSKGKMLLKQTLQKGILIATSSCKNSAAQEKTDATPRKQHDNAIKTKYGAAQATNTPTLSKTHLEHISHQTTGKQAAQNDDASDNITEPKPETLTIQITPSPPSPPSQGLNQRSKMSLVRSLKRAIKSPTHASANSTAREAPKQEVTMEPTEAPQQKVALKKSLSSAPKQEVTMEPTEAHQQKVALKKSLSSPAISQTPLATSLPSPKRSNMTPIPSMKSNHPSTVLVKVASSSSPRARASPSPTRRSPLVSSRVNRAAPTTRPATQLSTSTPERMPRRASFGESASSSYYTSGRSLSPIGSRATKSHPIGMKDSTRSLSPLSPRLARAQPSSPGTCTAATTASSYKGSTTILPFGTTSTEATPARPTRLNS